MANSNYKECWWLTRAISGEFGAGSFKKGDGYFLEELADYYANEFHAYYDMTEPKEKKTFSVRIWRLRIKLYFQFGLVILCDSKGGKKGNGGYYYYLANPDFLNEKGRSIREHIELLARYENNIPKDVDWDGLKTQYAGTSMGFISTAGTHTYGYISTPGTTPRQIIGEETLQFVQFAMVVGEVLTIKYGKVTTGIDINAPYSFEPYQVKEIEGRWYAIGNLYPMGHKESAELAVYDLARLEFAYDEENPDVLYEPIKDFDVYYYINRMLDVDGHHPVITGPVISVDIKLNPRVSGYIKKYPLCSAQVSQGRNQFKLYIRFTHDLITQMGAYGDELSLKVVPIEDSIDDEYYGVIQDSLELFRNADENKLFD